MSYKPGQVRVYNPAICTKKDKWGNCDCRGGEYHDDPPYEAKRDFPGNPVVFLPHSCDQWIIGGKEQIKAMIADLQAALKAL